MKVLSTVVLVLLASCTASEASRVTYKQEGTDMIATLSDGTAIRAPCALSTTREVTRIGKSVDNCEISPDHRQIILERQREIDEPEQKAAASK